MACGCFEKRCCVCGNAGGCLASMHEDLFCAASRDMIIKRLDEGCYSADRQFMIDWLWEKHSYCYELKRSVSLRDVVELLQKENGQWVSTEDRLPDKTTKVLVWVGVNYNGAGMYPEERTALYNCVYNRFFVDCDWRNEIIGNVICWMPLPKPPKEDNNGVG